VEALYPCRRKFEDLVDSSIVDSVGGSEQCRATELQHQAMREQHDDCGRNAYGVGEDGGGFGCVELAATPVALPPSSEVAIDAAAIRVPVRERSALSRRSCCSIARSDRS
jgi:hypothetical protein